MLDTRNVELYVGLMSGTSMDAVDAVIVELAPDSCKLVAAHSHEIEPALKAEILSLCSPGGNELFRMKTLDRKLGQLFAEATGVLLDLSRVRREHIVAIGSHGQTIRHSPDSSPGFSVQIGDPHTIAEQTGILTVADFRQRDIAAGGQGAPLLPLFHEAYLLKQVDSSCVINIGGMANISALINNGKQLVGYDTGPGNVLLDYWINQHKKVGYDENGNWAASGEVIPQLLASFLSDDYFDSLPPKSTGRERFNERWLRNHIALSDKSVSFEKSGQANKTRPQDIQCTLAELTARSITDSALQHAGASTLILCGGGAKNDYLMERIKAYAKEKKQTAEVKYSDDFGLPADWVEAMGFAWFAQRTLNSCHSSTPGVTGASHDCILGSIHAGKNGLKPLVFSPNQE
ncbi:MAG: anhydro-N-acetylmuramic acid kinase [Gammaproteobacteria bacterium]|nr:MAG: anhydro-N-acetylmuramic acid kinase [Pseudomonadota bacterium]PIE38583.1 MAG: anhydro-N-acetylmuramic acid kinase [Gammaproteobacteria bacterium]